MRAISLEISQPSVTRICLNIIFLRFYWNLPGVHELTLDMPGEFAGKQDHWPFLRGIHQLPVDSPHKGPVIWSFNISFFLTWTSASTNGQGADDGSALTRMWRHWNDNQCNALFWLMPPPCLQFYRPQYFIRLFHTWSIQGPRCCLPIGSIEKENREYYLPPVHRKTWFYRHKNHIHACFASSPSRLHWPFFINMN